MKIDINKLNKDKKIISLINYLFDKYGEESFKINDCWDSDLIAIGLCDKTEKYLMYIAAYDDYYFASLENPPVNDDFPYDSAGDYDNIDLTKLEELFVKHLRINI